MHLSHNGSRADYNTSTGLLGMYDHWTESVERGSCAGVMMLDLSAAFDLVNHSLLFQKFHFFGFDGKTIEWCKSHLKKRLQLVYVDGPFSALELVPVGVPQGSAIGALFCILLVKDLPGLVHEKHLTIEEQHNKDPWEWLTNCNSYGAYHIATLMIVLTHMQVQILGR